MSAGKIALGLIKWIVVPAAFLAIGYQFIGPTIGAKPPKAIQNLGKQIGVATPKEGEAESVVTKTDEPVPNYPEPKVSLRVTKRSGTPSEERGTRRSSRSEPSEEAPVDETPASDGDGVPVDTPTGTEGNLPDSPE